ATKALTPSRLIRCCCRFTWTLIRGGRVPSGSGMGDDVHATVLAGRVRLQSRLGDRPGPLVLDQPARLHAINCGKADDLLEAAATGSVVPRLVFRELNRGGELLERRCRGHAFRRLFEDVEQLPKHLPSPPTRC